MDIDIQKIPKKNIWLFNSAGDFVGNVKYLFIYINKYRPDIYACYISGSEANVKYIKSLGYRVCSFVSPEGIELMKRADVYVNEHVKEHYPLDLCKTKLLNLFHGVGLKQIERKWKMDFLALKIAKKYIQYNEHFINNMCFLVTSPFMEEHFKDQLALSDKQVIRAGYPRCVHQSEKEKVQTFNHDILATQGLSLDTKIALYAPTYRDQQTHNFLYTAIKDVHALFGVLKKNKILLIIKLHPKISNDFYFKKLQEVTKVQRNILLWDNQKDIYEIFDQIDIGIVDYSSIYYDLVASGVKKFIRYIFDYESVQKSMLYDYNTYTIGLVCKSFKELLDALNQYDFPDDTESLAKIHDIFFAYSTPDTCEQIIEQTIAFQPQVDMSMPVLYSFDVFDTLIARKVLQPRGIFYKIMGEIKSSKENFPEIFKTEYVAIRMQAEANVREFVKKDRGHFEITFDDIFKRIADVYHLTEKEISLLKKWEIEAEYEDTIPFSDNVTFAEKLIRNGEQVVLICDMYLPKKIIQNMISKVSPTLAQAKIFLSSDLGVQKTTQLLFLEVYHHFDPWPFKEWKHFGDNKVADGTKAQSLGIVPTVHPIPAFNKYEQAFVDRCRDYDSYLIAGMLARTRFNETPTNKEYFAFAHVGFYFVPYIAWVIQQAVLQGIETLYFISRDGFFLKEIADEYIQIHDLTIKTKYIYGSRRAWRIPSMINEIDDTCFSNFGNFTGVANYENLLKALSISHCDFQKFFPELGLQPRSAICGNELTALMNFFKESPDYRKYLLQKATEQSSIVIKYLHQEIDFSENFAFVEYWGRGYTQTCLSSLLNIAADKKIGSIFYYYRSILPSQGSDIRYNYSTNNTTLLAIEAVFANFPHSTILGYQEKKGKIIPIFDAIAFDHELYNAMNEYLVKFVKGFYALPFVGKREAIQHICSDFSLYWYRDHQEDPNLVHSLGHLLDSVTIWGNPSEFAPKFTSNMLSSLKCGGPPNALTRSIKMSLARSTPAIRAEYEKIINNNPNAFRAEYEKIINNNPNAFRAEKDTKIRLLNKLNRNPKAFFSDSRHKSSRLLGKIAFSKPLCSTLGKVLLFLTIKVLTRTQEAKLKGK